MPSNLAGTIQSAPAKYAFTTRCVESDAKSITDMCERARPISFRTFARRCLWQPWARSVGYATGGERGLRLNQDYHVRFFRSRYRGRRCYFVVWSAIEIVFAEPVPSC